MTAAQHIISVEPNSALCVDGEPLGTYLTTKEAVFIKAVFAHRGVATKEYLLDTIYAGRDEPELKIIDVWLCKVRNKLGPHKDAIHTVWGRGYCASKAYGFADTKIGTIDVQIDATLVEELVMITGEPADVMVNKILKAERDRHWSEPSGRAA